MTSKKALINAHMMKTSHTGLLYLFSGPDNNPNLIIAMTTAKPYIGHTGPKRKPLFTQCLYLILQKTHSQIHPANENSINALKYCATNNFNYLVVFFESIINGRRKPGLPKFSGGLSYDCLQNHLDQRPSFFLSDDLSKLKASKINKTAFRQIIF